MWLFLTMTFVIYTSPRNLTNAFNNLPAAPIHQGSVMFSTSPPSPSPSPPPPPPPPPPQQPKYISFTQAEKAAIALIKSKDFAPALQILTSSLSGPGSRPDLVRSSLTGMSPVGGSFAGGREYKRVTKLDENELQVSERAKWLQTLWLHPLLN